ncbi:MAG: ribose-5-phosphate isomerase RpiA [Deltaproteobacteria bacterium]|nr:ribose-5-phosphate isomerase RpiA [Deltaproteobacteria bacterium]
MDLKESLKQQAAYRAADYVESGMVLGLGTGSTTKFAIERIAKLFKSGRLKNIVGVPSSHQTEKLAHALGIPLTTLNDHPEIELTIDGADEVDSDLNLIKGGGGALLREKILAQASRRNIIIVDESKLSSQLGIQWALPVEVIPFARQTAENFLKFLGASVTLRSNVDASPFRTDQNNLILDADFGAIPDPQKLAFQLSGRAGIVEHGLFLGLASEVIVAGEDGIRLLKRNNPHE